MRTSQAGVVLWACLLCGGYGSALAAEPSEDNAPSLDGVPSPDGAPSLEERVQEILSAPAEDEKAAVRCIHSMEYDRAEVLDDLRVVFHGRRDKRWLNQLRIRCPGLRKRDTLQFEMRSMRLCEMDSFRSIDPSGFGMPGASCSLGSFEPVTPDQVEMLKDALRAERDAKRKSGG